MYVYMNFFLCINVDNSHLIFVQAFRWSPYTLSLPHCKKVSIWAADVTV